jgi:palmitoyltransferase
MAGSVAIILPYVFLYLASFSDPGFITPENHAHAMAMYPYDFTIFHPGPECRTCRLQKPARSKHCSICKGCISRADHHCIFINNCVGANNHRWFILLLLSTGVLTVYGGLLGMEIMMAPMRQRYPLWRLWPWLGNNGAGMPMRQYLVAWSYGLQNNVGLGAVTMLSLLTSPLVWGMLIYHIWLVYCGTTTNETMKWSDWQAEMDDGFAFKRKMMPGRDRNTNIEPAWTRWPVETEQIVVRTEDGNPPNPHQSIPGVGAWEQVWKLRDVENLYDLGFWDNFLDVMIPDYRFPEKDVLLVERRGRRRKKRRGG